MAAEAVTARTNDEEPISGLSGLAQVFDSWDGHWYLDVVREGYPHHIMPNVTYFVSDARAAFFPLYPRLVHYLDMAVPGGPVSVALLVNLLLGGLFIARIGKRVRKHRKQKYETFDHVLRCIGEIHNGHAVQQGADFSLITRGAK